jgi:hypothetical protein
MSSELQHKLLNLEVSPPEDSWKHIALRLEDEFDVNDQKISEKLNDTRIDPPFQAWENISEQLYPEISPELYQQNRPAPIVVFSLRRIAAAVVILMLLAAATYFILPGTGNASDLADTDNQKNADIASGDNQNKETPSQVPEVIKSSATPPLVARIASRYERNNSRDSEYQEPIVGEENSDRDIRYADPDHLARADAEHPISIPSKPITDPQGNIIMDENLVTTPNTHYITVTGPNGQQTRISRKFLRALSYMNAIPSAEDSEIIIHESALWKWLFQEWRNKLLREPSFIPSSTNFLDILEFKELLTENF